jgi:hypothetical protein
VRAGHVDSFVEIVCVVGRQQENIHLEDEEDGLRPTDVDIRQTVSADLLKVVPNRLLR